MRTFRNWLLCASALALASCSSKETVPPGPVVVPACATSRDCGPGQVCSNGTCGPCASDEVCAAQPRYGVGAKCVSGGCVACTRGTEGCGCNGGACDNGLVCDAAGVCRGPRGCDQAGCVANQKCQPPSGGQDAKCLAECNPGFVWNAATSACDPVPANCNPAQPGSILAACDEENRTCVSSAGGASCGACKAGFVEEAGLCVAPTRCDQIDCAAQNRACVLQSGSPRCTTCLSGYVESASGCRPVVTCASLDCESRGLVCNDPGPTADATCVAPSGCTNGVLSGTRCIPCFCGDDPGEETTWEPVPSAQGYCVCHTKPGYYFASVKAEPCDADGDGWVRIGARSSIVSNDPPIRKNARCTLRRVTAFVLENDPGGYGAPQRLEVTPQGGETVDLYESGVLDDNASLKQEKYDRNALPPYGTTPGVPRVYLRAEQLNSLTKACTHKDADFNDDGFPDVKTLPTSPADPVNGEVNFVRFAYFMESHRGWFEPVSVSEPTEDRGVRIVTGKYHIREKRRPLTPYPEDVAAGLQVNRVPFAYRDNQQDGGSYWTQCLRRKHPNYQSTVPGWDFADAGEASPGFLGMTHTSQFRCVELDEIKARRADLFGAAQDAASAPLLWNWCSAAADANTEARRVAPVAGGADAYDADFTCQPEVHTANAGVLPDNAVGWVVTRYVNDAGVYRDNTWMGSVFGKQYAGYKGGCINECFEQAALPAARRCRGYGNPGQACEDDAGDFGRLVCGCAPTYGGLSCEVGCPAPLTEKSPTEMLKASRDQLGYWMCGRFSGTEDTLLAENPSAPNTGYRLRGEVPVEPPVDTPTSILGGSGQTVLGSISEGCNDSDPATPCYTLRGSDD